MDRKINASVLYGERGAEPVGNFLIGNRYLPEEMVLPQMRDAGIGKRPVCYKFQMEEIHVARSVRAVREPEHSAPVRSGANVRTDAVPGKLVYMGSSVSVVEQYDRAGYPRYFTENTDIQTGNALHPPWKPTASDAVVVVQTLLLSWDIWKAFAEAPHELKRTYLALFWEKIVVKVWNIVEAVPTLLFRSVGVETAPIQEKASEAPTSTSVRSFNGSLPGPSDFITLIQDKGYWDRMRQLMWPM